MRYLIYGAMALLALRLLEPLVLWWRVWQTRFRDRVRIDKADPTTFPPELAPIFAEAAGAMAALGFEPSHAQWSDALVLGEQRRPSGVFVHRATNTFAEVCPPVFQNGRRLYCVAFTTYFEQGPALLTLDGLLHLTPVLPASTDVRDHYLGDLTAQWEAHLRAVAERTADTPKPLAPSAYMRAQAEAMTAGIDHGRRNGTLEHASTGACSLTWRAAWHAARVMRAGARRTAAAERERAVDTNTNPEAWAAADLYAFAYAEARTSARTPRARMQLFAVSLAASAVALSLILGWAAVPGLLVVLLLHELGHIAGMRLFGYRDTQILFVPFLGAAALGRKDDASATEKLIVLLLGPVPGIILGMIALYAGNAADIAWLADVGLLAVVLNYLNLLPFTPLDGGRIVDVLLLHRYPRAGIAFLLMSTVVAGLAGLLTADPFLTLLSVLMLAALPGRWLVGIAAANAMRRLGRSHRPRPERIRAAFEALQTVRRPLDASGRVAFAKAIMEHLDTPSAPRSFAVAGAALYCTLLVAPLVATAMILVPDPDVADLCVLQDGDAAANMSPEYGEALAEMCADPAFPRLSGPAQWKTLVDRAGHRLATGDSTVAVQYYRLAHNAAVLEFDDDDPRRIATRKLVQELAAAEAARALALAAAAAAADTIPADSASLRAPQQ